MRRCPSRVFVSRGIPGPPISRMWGAAALRAAVSPPTLAKLGGSKGPPIQRKQGPEPKARAKGQSLGGGGQNHLKIQLAHLRFATRSPSPSPSNSSSLPTLRVTLHRATCNIKNKNCLHFLSNPFIQQQLKKSNNKKHKETQKGT